MSPLRDPGLGLKPQTHEQLRRIVLAIDAEIERLAYGRQVIQNLIEQEAARAEPPAAEAGT